jgi:hypothetical protein
MSTVLPQLSEAQSGGIGYWFYGVSPEIQYVFTKRDIKKESFPLNQYPVPNTKFGFTEAALRPS